MGQKVSPWSWQLLFKGLKARNRSQSAYRYKKNILFPRTIKKRLFEEQRCFGFLSFFSAHHEFAICWRQGPTPIPEAPPSCGLGDRRWPKWHSPQLLQNPHRSWGVGLGCWLIKLHVFIHPPSLGKFFLKDKCSVVLEVWNRRQCTKFSKSNTDTPNCIKWNPL